MHKLGNMAPEISRLDMFRTLLEDRSLVVLFTIVKQDHLSLHNRSKHQ